MKRLYLKLCFCLLVREMQKGLPVFAGNTDVTVSSLGVFCRAPRAEASHLLC